MLFFVNAESPLRAIHKLRSWPSLSSVSWWNWHPWSILGEKEHSKSKDKFLCTQRCSPQSTNFAESVGIVQRVSLSKKIDFLINFLGFTTRQKTCFVIVLYYVYVKHFVTRNAIVVDPYDSKAFRWKKRKIKGLVLFVMSHLNSHF